MTRRRLEPALIGRQIQQVVTRTAKLRLPVPTDLGVHLTGRTLREIRRRGKYLLFDCGEGWLIIHLGMTGFLRLAPDDSPPGRHDHLEIGFSGGTLLRLHDPRKFGTVLWHVGPPLSHPLLAAIGPEPLETDFDGDYLFQACRRRTVAVKLLLMNASVVAGVGNIYANEALFRARIRPDRPSASLSREECARLSAAVRCVLEDSLASGSTYRVAEETVSYHPLDLSAYGRGGAPCPACGGVLTETRLGGRSTVYCPECQV
jgi:formamidopyrimidine-DNA glycosylase